MTWFPCYIDELKLRKYIAAVSLGVNYVYKSEDVKYCLRG